MANFYIKSSILFFLVIVSWFLVISVNGCGDIETEITSLSISPSSVTVGINKSQTFSAYGEDSVGAITKVDPTWKIIGAIGSINSSGLFIAGGASGEGYVVASYEGKSAQASVAVTENGWLTGRIQSDLGYAAGIKVYLAENVSLLDFSDSSGRYTIPDIPPGTYEARTMETDLYKIASTEITINKGEPETWNVFLESKIGPIPTTTLPSF